MKLNMRLIGWLYGIMMLSIIGRIMFEAWRFAGTTRRSSNGKDNGAVLVVIAIMLAGIALIIIGSIGVFFGRMIQAAISRQLRVFGGCLCCAVYA